MRARTCPDARAGRSGRAVDDHYGSPNWIACGDPLKIASGVMRDFRKGRQEGPAGRYGARLAPGASGLAELVESRHDVVDLALFRGRRRGLASDYHSESSTARHESKTVRCISPLLYDAFPKPGVQTLFDTI